MIPSLFLMSFVLLILYTVPYLLYHWRILDAHAEAETFFMKRRAELKAEAEHADQRLDLLDKRVHLTSLGFREVVRKVAPNVVNVVNYREPSTAELKFLEKKKSIIYDPDNDKKYMQSGVGSGLIIKPGVILTNYHVVKGAQRLRVSFASGQSIGIDANAVIADAITDLAVIRLPENLPAALKEEAQQSAVLADSEKDVQVGDWVLAIGSPHGLRQTVTHGVISAKGRLLGMLDLVELLQTDAAMNPGNSGGPLFDQHGRVVGINVAIVSENGGSQGLGFAIPSNTVKKIADQLIANGRVVRSGRAYLGVRVATIVGGGVLVSAIVPGGPAAKAGIKVGDVVLAANEQPTPTADVLVSVLADLHPGQKVPVRLLRHGKKLTVTVTLGELTG
jgi:S1-C subfamily serine protease